MLNRRMVVGVGLILAAALCWSSLMLQGQSATAPAARSSPQELAQRKVAIAKKALGYLDDQVITGRISGSELRDQRATWSRRLYESEAAAARNSAERIAAARDYQDRCRKAREVAQVMFSTGQINAIGVSACDYELADAELILAELQSR